MKLEKIKTDNIPLLDELVYYLKRLCLYSVVKNEEKSLKYETMKSIRESSRYIACVENRANFKLFDYTYNDLKNSSLPEYLIDECLKDKNKVPENVQIELTNSKINYYLNNYVELNDYYRMLYGLPNIGEKGIKIPEEYYPKELNTLDRKLYIHEYKDNEIDVLRAFGVIDKLIQDYPEKRYLRYMGSIKINPYTSRTANNFSLIFVDTETPKEVLYRFKEKYEINRVYTLKTIYSDAFKLGSDYYDEFIGLFIILQTVVDMISEMPDFIIKRDLFDIRMIQLFFEYHGIDFFPEIPMKYQKAMIRNLNRLIKYKSTTKNIVDICSLFGFDNIEVFKYYLLKERKVDKFGNYEFNYKDIKKEDGSIETVEDNDKNFDLKFIKIPIDDNIDNYIHDKSKYTDYDEIVDSDKYWNGDLPHDLVKSAILEKEFNYLQSKYLSIDTIYSLTELSFQMIYFYNMLFDDVIIEDLLKIQIPIINSTAKFKFVDVLCYLYSLMYIYNGIEDDLMDEPEKILEIKGFNFDVDMNELASYVAAKGFTLEELGVSEFYNAKDSILSYNQLMNIFTNNKKIYDHLVKEMYNADNKKIYDIYKKLYDTLMINNFSMEFFKKKDGTIAKTYLEFLQDRDLILYYSLLEIREIDSDVSRKERINNLINDIVYIIEQYLESDDYKFLFAHLPAVSSEAIKQYIYKVVNFFKSYKVDIYNINTIYRFDDKLENKINIIDDLIFKYIYTRYDTIELFEKPKFISKLNKSSNIKLIEQIYMELTYWIELFFNENLEIKDDIRKLQVDFYKEDCSGIHEKPSDIISKLIKYQLFEFEEKLYNNSVLDKDEYLKIIDNIFMNITYWVDIAFITDTKLKEEIKYSINCTKNEYIEVLDKVKIGINTNYLSRVDIFEKLKISTTTEDIQS